MNALMSDALSPAQSDEWKESGDSSTSPDQISDSRTDVGSVEVVVPADAVTSRARLEPWKESFLAELRASSNVTKACKAGNVSRDTAYEHRGHDKVFSKAWDNAKEGRVDRILETAMDLADGGDQKLIEFLLKTLRRSEFGDKLDVSLTGQVAHLHMGPDDVARIVAEHLAGRLEGGK